MHLVMDHFRSEHARFEIDLNHLFNEPLQNIRPFLSHRPEDFNYLEALSLELHEIRAVPILVAIRDIWLMGLHTGNAPIWGAWQNDHYFNEHIKFLRNWCEVQGIVIQNQATNTN